MPITREELAGLLKKAFPEADIEIKDLAGDNDHWEVRVISSAFNGKKLIEQHKMVQNAVADHNIHALSIKTGIRL